MLEGVEKDEPSYTVGQLFVNFLMMAVLIGVRR